jgi:multidrug resistance efflux pump
MVSTDDAYVQAHSVLISPKVSGYISEASVDRNQSVHAGDILVRIDPRDYQTALKGSSDEQQQTVHAPLKATLGGRIRRRRV